MSVPSSAKNKSDNRIPLGNDPESAYTSYFLNPAE